MTRLQLPASGGRYLRDDKGALIPDAPGDTPAEAPAGKAPAAPAARDETPRKPRVKET